MASELSPGTREFLGFTEDGQWNPPVGIDPEVVSLCRAMNLFPGIFTIESCCGHGRDPFGIYFMATSLDALPSLLYWFSACHTGQEGWRVRVYTDCSADHATFVAEGPVGGYKSAEVIAKYMREAIAAPPVAADPASPETDGQLPLPGVQP
jgi:hypothetical protein